MQTNAFATTRSKRFDPVEFAVLVLNEDPYQWQANVMFDLEQRGSRVALKAANGSGKTTKIVAPICLWHANEFARSKTILTSGVFRQVKEQLFPALAAFSPKFKGWKFNDADILAPNGSKIIGFSTDDPNYFEGWHAEDHDESPLLMIFDESKAIEDRIFEAKERCQPTRELLLSSPGLAEGYFYKCFGEYAKDYSLHTVTAFDCPHISNEWINRQIEKYGIQHPLIRSMIFAEFMESSNDGLVIPRSHVESLLRNPPMHIRGARRAFCDFAAGGDENVLAVRDGNKVSLAACWRERDTMKAVGQFIVAFRKHNLKPEEIWGDNDGLGRVMIDALHEAGWPINREHNGSDALDKTAYQNRGAEVWFDGARKIERGQVIIPDDKDLISQLCTRKGGPNSKGKMQLESKDKMKSSPDRADAVLGSLFDRNVTPVAYLRNSFVTDQIIDSFNETEREPELAVSGWEGY